MSNPENLERAERVQIMLDIRAAVFNLVEKVFDEIDADLENFTFTQDNVKMIRASRARLTLKSTRKLTLDSISAIGADYESK